MPEDPILPVAPAPVAAPDAAVLKAAEEVFAQSRAAVAASEQSRRELEAKVAALEAKLSAPAAPAAPAPEIDELKAYITRERQTERLSAVRRMGLDVALSDEQLLAIVPDVDPRDPAGLSKLEAWRNANARMFRASGPTPESVIEAVKTQTADLSKKAGSLFQLDKAAAAILGGGR